MDLMPKSDKQIFSVKSDGCGCFTIIFVVILIWAIIFGVTVNGHHYGLAGCNTDNGVKVDTSVK